jgi:hypothetical protein
MAASTPTPRRTARSRSASPEQRAQGLRDGARTLSTRPELYKMWRSETHGTTAARRTHCGATQLDQLVVRRPGDFAVGQLAVRGVCIRPVRRVRLGSKCP